MTSGMIWSIVLIALLGGTVALWKLVGPAGARRTGDGQSLRTEPSARNDAGGRSGDLL